jgi:hypothetical protein
MEKATPEPWGTVTGRPFGPWVNKDSQPLGPDGTPLLSRNWKDVCLNAALIVEMRAVLPALLDERETLLATIAAFRSEPAAARLKALTDVHEFYEFDATTEEQFDAWLHEEIQKVRPPTVERPT